MQPKQWSKEELANWKAFWESDMGKIAISKIKELGEAFGYASLQTTKTDEIVAYTGRRAGIEAVLADIQTGIQLANEANKEKEAEQPTDENK